MIIDRNMFDNKDVIGFFDSLAPDWDKEIGKENGTVIDMILDNASVSRGDSVLDVGCGTGRLFPYYLKRNVSSIMGIDISSGMIEAAKRNCLSEKIVLICDDASEHYFEKSYDRIVVFDAFPHFTDPERMMQNLSEHLSEGGTLTIAHDSSREEINRRHTMMRKNVSHVLMDIDELESIVSEYLTVTYKRSDDRIYQIVGRKQKES